MLAKDFIMKEIPVLKSFDTVEYALAQMDDFKLKHLPVLVDGAYRCLISEKELFAYPDGSAPVGEPSTFAPFVTPEQHLFEILRLISHFKLSLIPIINADGSYVGVITLEQLTDALAELCNVEAEGSVVVLELVLQDYSLTDISRLIESNNAHVLSLLSHVEKDTEKMILSIKIDLEDASPVIRSFERFNYTVLYYYMKKGMVDDLLKKRMDELLYYMNM